MKVLVLPQKLHGGEIGSVDINAAHTWMATGGADSSVAFWDLSQFSGIADASADTLTQLAPEHSIHVHDAPVSVLRWCPTMDHIVVSADTSGRAAVLNLRDLSHKDIFPWPSALETHNAAAIDGLWSRDGRLFAWSTSDGCVHLYDVERHTHQLLVDPAAKKTNPTVQRGISFDPTSNLLATFDDETCVTVYQYQFGTNGNYQFKVHQTVTKLAGSGTNNVPKRECRRLAWSCDGEFVAVPAANKQLNSLIALMARSHAWDNKVNLVGQDMNCSVISFAPRIFDARQNDPEPEVKSGDAKVDEDSKINAYHIILSAGSDRSFVLWNTSKETPLLVVKDITSGAITDVAWNLSANSIYMVTEDGHVVVAAFSEEELGYPAPERFLDKLKASQLHAVKAFVVKSDDNAKVRKNVSEIVEQKNAFSVLAEFSKPVADPVTAETVTVDSQPRRPFSDAQTTVSGDYTPVELSADGSEYHDASNELSKRMEIRVPEGGIPDALSATKAKVEPKTPKKTLLETQKVTKKDGKKHIQPVLISNGSNASLTAADCLKVDLPMNTSSVAPSDIMAFEKSSYLVPEDFQKEAKRSKTQENNGPAKKAKRAREPVKFIGSAVVNPNTTYAKVRLSVPKIRGSFRVNSSTSKLTILDIRNGEGNEHMPSRVTQFTNETQVWTDFIPKYIQLAVDGDTYWAICTSDGQINVYSHFSGKRLLPPLVLGAPLSFLESHCAFLLAVTLVGELYVWNIATKKMHLHAPQSVATLLDLNSKYQDDGLSRADSISMCSVTGNGVPLLTLTNGSGYMYNVDLGVWQTVSETWWAFGSHYWDSITDDKVSTKQAGARDGNKESSIIGLLEHKTNEEIVRKSRMGRGRFFNKISKNMIMKEGFENLENVISLSHLENRILCSELLGEKADFKDFLLTYAKRLSELGQKGKLFEFCQDLLGKSEEPESDAKSGLDKELVCGWNKHDLLKEIVVDCAEHRDSQRILAYFGQKLGIIEAEY